MILLTAWSFHTSSASFQPVGMLYVMLFMLWQCCILACLIHSSTSVAIYTLVRFINVFGLFQGSLANLLCRHTKPSKVTDAEFNRQKECFEFNWNTMVVLLIPRLTTQQHDNPPRYLTLGPTHETMNKAGTDSTFACMWRRWPSYWLSIRECCGSMFSTFVDGASFTEADIGSICKC